MLTPIIHDYERLCTFLDQVGVELCPPQRRYIINRSQKLAADRQMRYPSAGSGDPAGASWDLLNMVKLCFLRRYLPTKPWMRRRPRVQSQGFAKSAMMSVVLNAESVLIASPLVMVTPPSCQKAINRVQYEC